MNYTKPIYSTKDELFRYLKQNKSLIIAQKKAAIKKGDSVSMVMPLVADKAEFATKDIGVELPTKDMGTVVIRCAINTTNYMDGHDDVHIPGLWKKSLSESKLIYHLQEHEMEFESVISDEVKAYTKSMTWKALGFDYAGNTEVLIFDSTVSPERNPFMYDQYVKGYVRNHSVGMQYVKIELAINSKEKGYEDEKAAWDKYYPTIVNKDASDEQGYFFAVTEAKVIEGSAVVRGSNDTTPTISISEAGSSTSVKIEPSTDTRKVDYNKLTKVRFFNN